MRTLRVVFGLLFTVTCAFGQPAVLPATKDSLPPGQNEHPRKAKFAAETDQRFFRFRNLSTGTRAKTSIWGLRAGVLLPSNVKIGAGYYFTNQQAVGQWNGYSLRNRRLSYGILFVEPFYFRRRIWELSTPFEVGYGTARYELDPVGQLPDTPREVQRTWAVPVALGASLSFKFVPIGRFKPTRWFGVNFLGGYRLTAQERVPSNPSTYNGLYYSISPIFFLDRFYEDFRDWRRNRR
jgi:hypothetical protein